MKNFLTIIIILLANLQSYAQWVKLPRVPATNEVKGVYFVDDTLGWVFNKDYKLFKTTNGGNNWVSTNKIANAIEFKNKSEGVIGTGYNDATNKASMQYTNNSGQVWSLVNNSPNELFLLNTVQYLQGIYIGVALDGDRNGFPYPIVYKIRNNKFETVSSPNLNWIIEDAFFTDTLQGYVISNNVLRKTVDGGKSWSALRTGVNFELKKMHFTSALHGVAIGGSNIIYTNNGGLTWQDVSIPGNKLFFNDVVFTTAKVGYVCGNQGIIYKTTDAGLTWKEMDAGTFENLYSLSFPDSTLGFCSGDMGTLLSLNEDYTQPQVLSTVLPSNQLCAGATYNISFTVNKKFNPNNIFRAYLSNATGDYSSSRGDIGSIQSDTSGIIKITIPASTSRNLGYRIRVQATSPESIGPNGEGFIEIQPSSLVGITISVDKDKICEQSSVKFSSSIVAGGTKPVIDWYVNNKKTATGQLYSYIPQLKDSVFAVLKSSIVCPSADLLASIKAWVVDSTFNNQVSIPKQIYIKVFSPIAIPSVSVLGDMLSSSASEGNQWYLNEELLLGAIQPNFKAKQTGMYRVRVSNGVCEAVFSDPVSVVINGMENQEGKLLILLYPNPATNLLHIANNQYFVKYTIYHSTGQKVLESNATDVIDISSLSEGLYLLEATDINGSRTVQKWEKR
jgi:photosystem II stability/assembly factor-like uncharacterized protein